MKGLRFSGKGPEIRLTRNILNLSYTKSPQIPIYSNTKDPPSKPLPKTTPPSKTSPIKENKTPSTKFDSPKKKISEKNPNKKSHSQTITKIKLRSPVSSRKSSANKLGERSMTSTLRKGKRTLWKLKPYQQ